MGNSVEQATLISRHSYHVPGKMQIEELLFEVPLDHSDPSRGTIRIFARSAKRSEPSNTGLPKPEQKPWLLWLQGGPGGGCPTPQSQERTPIFLDRGYQVLHMDQRGTGLSTPVTAATLALRGGPEEQADYLKFFRADNIVRDAEAIRKFLTAEYPEDLKKWTIWGQSYGGYCSFTYLSLYPEGLREVFVSGGVPPIGKTVDQIYSKIFFQTKKRNKAYYEKFPMDSRRIHTLIDHFDSKGGLALPSGGVLTGKRFLILGMNFGFKGGIQNTHDLVLRMATELEQFGFITRPSLSIFEDLTSFDDHIIYAVLREAIYCDGMSSNWSAERVGASMDEYNWIQGARDPQRPIYFAGGMALPFIFDISPELQQLKEVAEILAGFAWPRLYDEEQLRRNEVPLYTASFVDDAYVDFQNVQDALEGVGNCKQLITNTMYHDAVRKDTKKLLNEMFALKDDLLE
ncbi:prolyl peptidase [Mollisia scopiformis]|uniref:Prolyl peptidase n=1 Tax=Mollisia scopiformis TaxID=149040 RepID=A0A194WUW1_MOLSC|nr:prolyl peptidase [Mollisia scopiformis]KUJ11397.1 prolyl peptidase [Mollisia scopiformis]